MEVNNFEDCATCKKPLPIKGYFCGGCLTQFKCQNCDALLEKDDLGCTSCGTPKKEAIINNQNNNTFRLHETSTDRTIEASFSDNVGKDLAGILRDAYSVKMNAKNDDHILLPNSNIIPEIDKKEFTEAEIVAEDKDQLEKPQKSTEVILTDFPALIAISMKNLPNSETEWITVYSFYASKFGKVIFSRADIIEKYAESKRKTTTKMSHLSRVIQQAVVSGYINPLQDGYSIIDKGIEKAIEVISRTSGSAPKPSSSSSKRKVDNTDSKEIKTKSISSKTVKPLKKLNNINFNPEGLESLESFYKNHVNSNDHERNLLFVYYLQEILKIEKISLSHIYTCYDVLELRISESFPQAVRNTKSKKGWIETEDTSNITLTVKGKNKIKSWNKAE